MPLYEQEQNRPLPVRRTAYAQLTPEQKQRRQMLAALGLLLLVLCLVIVKDRDFWFPPTPLAQTFHASQTVATVSQSPTPAATTKDRHKAAQKVKSSTAAVPSEVSSKAPIAPVVTNRAVLPPLEIEVIAGNRREAVQEKNNSINMDMGAAGSSEAASTPTTHEVVSNASQNTERVQLSTDTAQVVTHPVEPNYPMLAKQMKVQGSVVLEALIGKDGKIQDLRTVSGPSILSSAAREAVQQWRFKPYYQAGQAVETVARITVNFTISAN